MTEVPIVIPEEEKGYQCQILLDSVNPAGVRLVTMRLKYPLCVHNEFLRHRCFSRSVSSNRAIPTARIIAMVEQDPFVPIFWGKNQPGMQAEEELEPEKRLQALSNWYTARSEAVIFARGFLNIGVHKQIVNRLLSPFQWVTEIVTATDWANFFGLRIHESAQPEIRRIAEMAREAYDASEPFSRAEGEWHLPLVDEYGDERIDLETKKKVSAARCARTSYFTYSGKVSTVEEDLKLYDRLVGSQPIHASPTEHQARALATKERMGNFRGWFQARMEIAGHTIED